MNGVVASLNPAGHRQTVGNFLKRKAGTATTTYPNQYFETAGATTTANVFLPDGTLIATITATSTATSTVYVHPDHLGSTNVTTNSNGDVVQTLDYYPYGSLRIDGATAVDESRKFTGHEFDRATDLTYAKARYYEQDIGRFLSQDPVFRNLPIDTRKQSALADPQLQNAYGYSKNNPLTLTDPEGEFAFALPYAVITAPEWGPVAGAALIGTAAFITSEISMRLGNGLRYGGEFDARRLPPPNLLGPQNPLEPNQPKIPDSGWIKWGLIGTGLVDLIGTLYDQYQGFKEEIEKFKNPIQGSANKENPANNPQNDSSTQSNSGNLGHNPPATVNQSGNTYTRNSSGLLNVTSH